jgi:hypothetical protein
VSDATNNSMINPFDPASEPDRHFIWHRLIAVDSDAFALGDWSMIENDFDGEQFEGIRCNESSNPDDWTIAFSRLEQYRDGWLVASREFLTKRFDGFTHREAVYHRTHLTQIDIAGDRAVAHKKFSGTVALIGGSTLSGSRQTLYRLHRRHGVWKIVGFLGQLPLSE